MRWPAVPDFTQPALVPSRTQSRHPWDGGTQLVQPCGQLDRVGTGLGFTRGTPCMRRQGTAVSLMDWLCHGLHLFESRAATAEAVG
jgi:hypothetical protein